MFVNRGYTVLAAKQPTHDEDGVLLFCDPHTTQRKWNGRRPLGCFHLSAKEEAAVIADQAELERLVRHAETELMRAL